MRTLIFVLALLCVASCVRGAEERLLIHEWGTFTSVQSFSGATLGGINTDDEPVPKFVRTVSRELIENAGSKGLGYAARPDVTMRLETPVVYFHPPKNLAAPIELDFKAQFKTGWLTQFYPDAVAIAPGLSDTKNTVRLQSSTIGSLEWKGLKIGAAGTPPPSDLNVWTAPRAVDAATVVNSKGEAEKFLFYRGVANLDAPLKVSRATHDSLEMTVEPQIDAALKNIDGLAVRTLWLAHFKADGSCAFAQVRPENFALNSAGAKLTLNARFSPGAYSAENRAALCSSMHKELMADGLFDDEATALLKTWEASYFKSSGMRLFFVLPKAWTNYYLPLTISVPSDVVRTMVGRIELLSPEQDAALEHISAATDLSNTGMQSLWPDVQKLGRFKTPLLIDRAATQPTPANKLARVWYALPLHQFFPRDPK